MDPKFISSWLAFANQLNEDLHQVDAPWLEEEDQVNEEEDHPSYLTSELYDNEHDIEALSARTSIKTNLQG